MVVVKEQVIDGVTVLTQSTPWYQNIWLGIAILTIIIMLIIIGLYIFRIRLKDRTLVIIHMPDKTRKVYAYKKFVGTEFKILTGEVGKGGDKRKHTYFFIPECVETGFWGRYIEYDFKVSYPLNPKDRTNKLFDSEVNKPQFFKFISGLLDTQLAVDLLLSNKFKEFVKIMLVIILIVVSIHFISDLVVQFTYTPVVQCELIPSNLTNTVIRNALTMP